MLKLQIKRNKSTVKLLSEKYGSTWKYRGHGFWEDLEDETRFVCKVSTCVCACEEVCVCPTELWLYGSSGAEKVYL